MGNKYAFSLGHMAHTYIYKGHLSMREAFFASMPVRQAIFVYTPA